MVGSRYRKTDIDLESETRKDQSQTGKDRRSRSYVGLASPDDALDVGETGAEARREQP